MKLSIATILWGKQKDAASFRSILDDVRKIGFDGIGLETRYLPRELLKNPRALGEMIKESGLENAGSYSSMLASDIPFALETGTPLFWVVVRREKTRAQALRVLSKFSSLARNSSITTALHNHLGTFFESEADVLGALEKIPSLELCFDTAHAEAAGIDLLKFIKEHHEKIALVHLKDLRVRAPKSKISFTRDFVNVGSGVIDFSKVIGALRKARYSGYLMLEIDSMKGKPFTPREIASEGYARISKLL